MTPDRFLSEEEARRLWQRAAELQADAARRLEERSHQLVPKGDVGEAFHGYALDHVRSAALEAGISPEFVDRALAEEHQEGGLAPAKPSGLLTRTMLGDVANSVEISRVFHEPAEMVYEAMKRIFPGPPYNLTLVDTRGDDPLNGAVLVFDVPKFAYGTGGGDATFSYEMAWADLKQFYVTLHTLSDDPPVCEVVVRSPLKRSKGVALGIMTTTTVAVALVAGGLVGAAVGGVLGLVSAAGGATGVGTLGAAGSRRLYRYSLGRSTRAVERLLGAIAGDISTGGGFSRRGAWPDPSGTTEGAAPGEEASTRP